MGHGWCVRAVAWGAVGLGLLLSAPHRGGRPAAAAETRVALPPQPAGVPWPTREWPVAPAETLGADPRRLARAVEGAFAEPTPTPRRRTRALVVVYRGRIVAERHAPGFPRATVLPAWSVTKSITSALVGVLVGEGRLAPGDVAEVPAWSTLGDPRRRITVDHLLRMSSGLAWTERYTRLPSDVLEMLFGGGRHDMAGYAARRPLAHPPGTRWEYSSGSSLILSGLARQAVERSGESYRAFPRRALFAPLGMRSALLEADGSGTFVGSSYGWATARDLARLGLLYLRNGRWAGVRVLPGGWVDYSRTPAPAAPRGEYGAHFWLNAGVGGRAGPPMPRVPRDVFYAWGKDGQFVVMVPSRDLVVVRLGLSQDPEAWDLERFLADLIPAFPRPP